ncbi:MAG: YafY family transcriptional regulator [Chloroflexia bacterium]|nr:YafY family transcriptional regulator [Chloroflexia bacterium]
MLETSARLLRLLSLLQTRRDWTGAELAERLGVSGRTVRNDVERLRTLGYPVHATRGATGGYRLGAGAALPPLLLDDEEAIAVAIGLRTAAGGTVAGIEDASYRTLAKLEQVLPARLRHRVNILQSAMAPLPGARPAVDPATLMAIATAVREQHRLRFGYRNHDGMTSSRETEPHWLAHTGHRWHLVAWDVDHADWRTFRVDRITPRVPTGPRFTPRQPPLGDVADYLARSIDAGPMRYRATVRVHAPAATIAPWLPPSVQVSPTDDESCLVAAGSDTPHMLAVYLGMLDVDFDVTGPPELVEQLRRLADRYLRAITPRPA